MLDFIEKNADDEEASASIEKFYSLTLESFQSANNERLWLKTNIKLARLWFATFTKPVKKRMAPMIRARVLYHWRYMLLRFRCTLKRGTTSG